jgi:hypothetical protein
MDVVIIGTSMFDEEDTWHVMTGAATHSLVRDREVNRSQFDALKRVGTVIGGMVLYPRADHWGRPHEATALGLLEWVGLEQGLHTCESDRFRTHFEDSADDGAAQCFLELWLPKGEAKKLFDSPHVIS